mmetsp:Transcript_2056/g.6812  ORF Transcript_2056/g.6812 Transcript_2056/m.6812 type:complete len:889 (+) Transcript_2056:1243-3909(+)
MPLTLSDSSHIMQAVLLLDCLDVYGLNACLHMNTRAALSWLLHKEMAHVLMVASYLECQARSCRTTMPPTCSDWVLCRAPGALPPSIPACSKLDAGSAMLAKVECMLCSLGLLISQDVLLVCKLARLIQLLLRIAIDGDCSLKSLSTGELLLTCKRILRRIVLPALSLITPNPGVTLEIWEAIKELGYEDRFLLYLGWRGRSLERDSIGVKHYELSFVECTAGFEARRMLKRVANERKFSKHVGRQLAKIAHSNPLVVFHVILCQIESYDNMIIPLIDSFAYMTPLALDVLAFMLPHRLAASSRAKLLPDGMTLSQWFQHLAHFTGLYYRTYPMTELHGLMDFILSSLRRGTSLDLIVLSNVVTRMGGCSILEDISEDQLNALAGGEILRRETQAFERASRRAVFRLQLVLNDAKLALPLLSLIAQQCVRSLFQMGMGHVKLAGQFHDKYLHVFYQLVEFLSYSRKRNAEMSGGNQSFTHGSSLVEPDLEMLCRKLQIEPHFAFRVTRSLLGSAVTDPRLSWDENKGRVGKNVCEWSPFNKEFCSKSIRALPLHYLTVLAPRFYVIFWSLTLQDVYLPVACYLSCIASLESRSSHIEGDLSMIHDKRSKDVLRNFGTIDLLKAELATRREQLKFVAIQVRTNITAIFSSLHYKHRRTIPEAMLQYCVIPRATQSPEDAMFAAVFIHQLHFMELPKFSSLLYFDRIIKDVIPLVLCATDREARSLGIYLKRTFNLLLRWRCNSIAYNQEAAMKVGFSLFYGPTTTCSFEQFSIIFAKWHEQATQTFEYGLRQYDSHGRSTLLTLIKLTGVFPVFRGAFKTMKEAVQVITAQNQMKDLQVIARRYLQILESQRSKLLQAPLRAPLDGRGSGDTASSRSLSRIPSAPPSPA